ncbi:MAG: glutamate racemase [Flavobacteriales bacterium]|nr:glutamate racemase [Flavobacteriales bacterium]
MLHSVRNYDLFYSVRLMDNRPIGIFDSGIGGLTVASELHRVLPNESILYFGDTVHLPYGDKSVGAITTYSQQIAELLLAKNCKAILIACNSASAVAYNTVKHLAGTSIPVFNVIDPVVQHVSVAFPTSKVGVIGTRATIASDVYRSRLIRLSSTIEVKQKSTSLLAPMIEEGFHDDTISQAVIHAYLEDEMFNGMEALIPACTHYPLIAKEIQAYFGDKVSVINAPRAVAEHIKVHLAEKRMLSGDHRPELHFLVSDLTSSFQKSAAIFFGEKVRLEEWKMPR